MSAPESSIVRFTFDGKEGIIDRHDFVHWANAGFHLENAGPDLRAAVAEARLAHVVRALRRAADKTPFVAIAHWVEHGPISGLLS